MHITSEHARYDFESMIKKDPSKFKTVLVKNPKYAKDVTWTLVINEIPFRKINYGSGVILFIRNDVELCSRCHGTGSEAGGK